MQAYSLDEQALNIPSSVLRVMAGEWKIRQEGGSQTEKQMSGEGPFSLARVF